MESGRSDALTKAFLVSWMSLTTPSYKKAKFARFQEQSMKLCCKDSKRQLFILHTVIISKMKYLFWLTEREPPAISAALLITGHNKVGPERVTLYSVLE